MNLRKVGAVLILMVLIACIYNLESEKSTMKEQLVSVYSFSGENQVLSVYNGVIVIGDEEQVLYGGNLDILGKPIEKVASYYTTFYVDDHGSEEIILSNGYSISGDENGMCIENTNRLGSISGRSAINKHLRGLIKDYLYMKLSIKYMNGLSEEHVIKMDVTEVTNSTK